ncbi:Ig-like domain-containing protein [Lachnospira rogosae (ex Hitch et al. 2025)]|uniref:Ig-like domain-containing protein n=1 Tax=[Lactobacillus] rogosae TaxID=706562 RepID=A0ABV1BT00_9FIRM
MNKKYVSKILAGILAVNMIVTSSSLTFATDNDSKDAYLNYQNETADINENYHATGYRELDEEYQIIPDVLNDNYSYIDGTEITKAAAYPSTYKTANLPDVRDQGSYGVCWAFSTISLIETNLIKKDLVSSDIDLSELHLVNYTYNCVNDPLGGLEGDINKFDTSHGSVMQYGGNVEMAANSLLDWEGAVNEDVVPYTTEYVRQVENNQLDDSLAYGKDVAHVQNFYRVNTTSKEDIKKAVMDYGAVSISYWSDQSSNWSTQYYNSLTAAYYCPEGHTTNHAVNIVGWDDDYSSDNFATKPEGNGAWIVRNSWGSEYGKDGYFYLSYYDKSIYSVGYTLEAELSDNYNNNYQYDGAMLYGYMGYAGSNKYSNIFEAKANLGGSENIKAVSFMTGSSTNLNYTVSVYTNLSDDANPESGTLAAQKSGVTTYDGMYTVVLDSSVNINEGKKFSVVVEVNSNSGKTSYLAYERSMQSGEAGYWCTASVKANQSFINSPYNGWNDFSNKSYGGNFIIKAFTDNETTTVDVEKVSLNKSATTLTEGESETLTATITPSNATGDKTVKWSSSNEAVATVDSNGKVTAKKAGTAVITATSSNGKTAGCTVTVKQKEIAITGISLNKSTTSLTEGESETLTATITPSNATGDKTVKWSSSNEAVAAVDSNGKVTAKKAGTAVITATSSNGKTAGCTVTVKQKEIAITGISLNKSTTSLTEGESETLTATITPLNATGDKTVKWSSSNEAVAAVDSNGKVTAKKAGTAVITATSSNGKTAGCTVTVKQKDTYTGLRDVNGTLTYFNNGQADKTYTGFVSYAGNNYYVINGVVDTSYTNVTYDGKDWLYVENGKVRYDYTGIRPNENGWWRIENGKVNFNYTGVAENENGWWRIEGGKVNFDYNGIAENENGWWKIEGGKVNFDYTGVAENENGWWRIEGGKVNFDYYGVAENENGWWKIEGGKVNFDYTGIAENENGWWRIENGKVNFNFTGVASNENGEFYIENGKVDFSKNGSYVYSGVRYNIINGWAYRA